MPSKPTKTKSRVKIDPFQKQADQPIVPAKPADPDPLDNIRKNAGVKDIRRASAATTRQRTAGIAPTDDMVNMLSRMKDIDIDPDLAPYPEPEPPEILPSTQVNTQNLPAIAGKALQAAGLQDPEFHQVAQLPGNMAAQIRQLGKTLFGSMTATPTDKIYMIGNVAGQGPNTTAEVQAVAAYLKNSGQDLGPGDIDFDQIMPGYTAQTHLFTADGIRWLLVKDFAGQYIYAWPEADSRDMSAQKRLKEADDDMFANTDRVSSAQAEFFRRYIDIIREAEDDMFASRQHQQIAHVFDRLAKDQFQFAEEEREEDDDPEAGNGYENDGESYLEVASAFRRGLQPGLKAWWYLDTMLTENSAEEVKDALGINLYELHEQLTESDDDAFGTRTLPLPPLAGKRGAIAREFIGLARGMIQSAQEHEAEDGNDHGCRSDAADYENVARAFAKSMEAGIDAWEGLDTLLQEDSADRVEAKTDIDLYELRDKARKRQAKTPAGQAAAAEKARKDAEWAAGEPERDANRVVIKAVDPEHQNHIWSSIEFDQREIPPAQLQAKIKQKVADLTDRTAEWHPGSIIKVTIGGKPVKV